jgi:hypothetical protein
MSTARAKRLFNLLLGETFSAWRRAGVSTEAGRQISPAANSMIENRGRSAAGHAFMEANGPDSR